MPPKIIFTKENIIATGLEIVREKGFESVTARSIAKKLNSSTQPIYKQFNNIKELQSALIDEAEKKAFDCMLNYSDPHSQFLAIGLGYFEFAINEPNFFRILYMSGKRDIFFRNNQSLLNKLLKKMKKDKFLKSFNDEILLKLLKQMSIYSHGLCTALNISDKDDLNKKVDIYRSLLDEMGSTLVIFEIMKQRGVIDLEKIKQEGKL